MNHIFFLFHMVSLIGVEASKAAMSTSVGPLSDSLEHIEDSRQVGTLKPFLIERTAVGLYVLALRLPDSTCLDWAMMLGMRAEIPSHRFQTS